MRTIIPKDAILIPEHADRVFKGQIYDVYQWEETMFDGTTAIFEMLKRPDTVEILAIHEDKILVQNQEQPHLGKFNSFAGGRCDNEMESELEAAQRELKEETGYVCNSWNLIDATQLHGKVEQFLYTFVVTDIVERVEQNLDAGEKIENVWLTLDEVRTVLNSNKIFRSQAHRFLQDISHVNDLLDTPEYKV